MRSEIFSPYESPYITSYITTFYLYLLPFSRYSTSKFLGFDLDFWLLEVTRSQNIFTIRKPIHDFLFNIYWHILSISYGSRDIGLQSFQGLTLTFDLWRAPEVKIFFTIRKPIHDFLSNFYWHSFSLSPTVFEIFDFKVFKVWPWPLTFRDHRRSKIFLPFESPYMTSYLTSTETLSLSRMVSEIFDFKVFRVWPWPLTFRGHRRSKIFLPFESMTSYLTSVDTFSLSPTVFEIFDFKVFRVTFRGHRRSKIFLLFENPCMTSYLTCIDTFSLSRTVFEKIRVKVFRVKQNGGFWLFQGQGHWPIFFISRKWSDSHQTASNDVLRVKIGSAVLAAPSSKGVKS